MSFEDILKKITDLTSFLTREAFLLLKSPKDYIYSYTYSPVKRIKIEKYDKAINAYGEDLVKQLHTLFPKLVVHFIGSAAMGIPGQRDIDLLIESQPADFQLYLPELVKMFGKPKKHKKSFVEWATSQNNCSLDIIMCDAASPILSKPLRVFKLLMSRPELLIEYEQIKLAADNTTVREYKKRRMIFFERIRSN